jgi:hypothetical protein
MLVIFLEVDGAQLSTPVEKALIGNYVHLEVVLGNL